MALRTVWDYREFGREGEGAWRAMNGGAARRASLMPGLVLGLTLGLGACGHHQLFDTDGGTDGGPNEYPSSYKSEILAAMHAYLNDPTGVRDAAISEPALKMTGSGTRYVVCIKFNPKKNASEYVGMRELASVFLAGRFDQFIEAPRDQCAGVTYLPFPELQKLSP
jgi:hypothetical protein